MGCGFAVAAVLAGDLEETHYEFQASVVRHWSSARGVCRAGVWRTTDSAGNHVGGDQGGGRSGDSRAGGRCARQGGRERRATRRGWRGDRQTTRYRREIDGGP